MIQLDLEQCAFTACLWEATARKAGNVHRSRDFPDLTYLDFVQSAHAIAPVIARMVDAPIGETVLECIRATRKVVNTNTNLGIVLLLVPLSKIELYSVEPMVELLTQTTVRDAELVYEAIRLASPAGLGDVAEQDVRNVPTETLFQVMTRAAERDTIARFYAEAFRDLFFYLMMLTEGLFKNADSTEQAICELQIQILNLYPDSLIRRKAGGDAAAAVQQKSLEPQVPGKFGSFYRKLDHYLRERGTLLNPGTTADLVTASLFVWLRTNKIDLNRPFTWNEYPG